MSVKPQTTPHLSASTPPSISPPAHSASPPQDSTFPRERIRSPANADRITNRILAVSGFHETTDRLWDPTLAGLVVLVGLPEHVDRGEGSTYPLDAYGTIEVPGPAGTPI